MTPSPDPAADRTSHFVQDLDQVRGLDCDLSLAIAYNHGTYLALTAARDIHQTLRARPGHQACPHGRRVSYPQPRS